MKTALLKDSVREIKNTYKRFISILLMAFLGVGFFAGIRATSPDMIDTLDNYYDSQNVYDIQVISTLGLTQEDIDELSKIENVEKVTGSFEKDGMIELENIEAVVKTMTLQDLNQPVLIEGELIKNLDECLVESDFLTANNLHIGDTITLEIEKSTTDDGEEIDYLKQKELKIVGTVQSPLYISRERGTSSLGAGKVNYYMYISPDNINASSVYTNIYIKVKDAQGYTTSSDKYDECVENVEDKIEEIKEAREQARHNQLVEIAQTKVNDAEKELNDQKADAEAQIADAEKQISDGEKEIEDGEAELDSQKKKADKEFANAQAEINSAKEQLSQNEETLNTQESGLTAQIEQITSMQGDTTALEAQLTQIKAAKAQLEASKTELTKQQNQLNSTKTSTYAQIQSARDKLENSRQEIADAKQELEEKKQEFNEKIADAESKLADAREKVSEIESPTWYILDRNSNAGYVGFKQDSDSIANLGKVFPIIFFAVATLISLTSMTRMVEEERGQLGTLKALGYTNVQITMKYVIYAALACVIGGILGMSVGFILLPKVIWMMYQMMYQISDISISFNIQYGGIGLLLICICIVGATIYTALKELVQQPAELMRPKAPKSGNRVFLEKIKFIWKHLNFSQKVTARNILRYKKRFYMTVIGICGCTALILTGFGIKDAVLKMIPNQFENIFQYNMQVTLKDSLSEEEKNNFINDLSQNESIQKITKTYMTSGTVANGEQEEDVTILVPEDESQLDGIININDLNNNNEHVTFTENQICLTDKAAELLDVKAGDTITLTDSDDREVQAQISNIVENYVQHYVYMSKQTYENLFQDGYKTNVILLKNVELDTDAQDKLATEIMSKNEVSAVTNIKSMAQSIEDMMSLLNYVVVVLIVAAGLLAFVVLYNLANVNISERIRELATIKVLGFYDKEVYDYVTRETVILTIIGIAIGLVGGFFLTHFITGTCEINMLRFSKEIKPISYVYAALITIVFTVIVNIATYFSLKKIDMIESLKSVE